MKYRKDIDGLRAVAVIFVLLYHAEFQYDYKIWFQGGFVGVDIFFVISGYLISNIIFRELFKKQKFNFRNFFERRFRRIFPLLITVMSFSTIYAYIVYYPSELFEYIKSALTSLFFSSNIYFYVSATDYGSENSLFIPLLHTWSLGIEEQFYLVFPLLAVLFFKRNYSIKRFLFIFTILSFGFAIILTQLNQPLSFYNPLSRFWEILVGSLIAYYEVFQNDKFEVLRSKIFKTSLLMYVSIFGLLISLLTFNSNSNHPRINSLLPVLCTAVILVNSKQSLVTKLFTNKAFSFIGVISYSLYLWHYPIFAFFRKFYRTENIVFTNYTKLLLLFAVFVISVWSYYFIEQPFRKTKQKNNYFSLRILFAYTISFFIISSYIFNTNGLEQFMIENKLSSEEVGKIYISKEINKSLYDFMYEEDCKFWSRNIDDNFIDKFNSCSLLYKNAIVVIGDSHAMNIYNIFAKSNSFDFIVGLSQGGCRPHGCSNNVTNHYVASNEFFKENSQQIHKIIFHQSGSYLIRDSNGQEDSQLSFDTLEYSYANDNFVTIAEYLISISKNNEIVWLGPFVEYRYEPIDALSNSNKLKINNNSELIFNSLYGELLEFASQYDEFVYVPFEDLVVVSTEALIEYNNSICFQFLDTDHFSECGESFLANNLNKRIIDSLSNG